MLLRHFPPLAAAFGAAIAFASGAPSATVSHGARAPTAKPSLTVVCLGDSITEGFGIAKEKAYPDLLEQKLKAAGVDARVTNAGISGSTSASAASRMRWILKSKPAWVILALGANDGLRGLSVDEMRRNLVAAVRLAHEAKAKVLLTGMRVPPNFGPKYSADFEKAFAAVAREAKPAVFDPFLLADVGGEKGLNQSDGIHPNEKGQEVIAARFARLLQEAVR